jgi:hypothetical protein
MAAISKCFVCNPTSDKNHQCFSLQNLAKATITALSVARIQHLIEDVPFARSLPAIHRVECTLNDVVVAHTSTS